MRYIWSIFLLLTVVAVAKSNILSDVFQKLMVMGGDKRNKCAGNDYKNDPALFWELDGYRYSLYTSVAYADNEIIMYVPKGNDSVTGRTTTDGKCCTTISIKSGEEYNPYDATNDADCSTELSDSTGHIKLIDWNEAADGTSCLIMWFCRLTRQGVNALCDNRTVSQEQTEWIQKQYDGMGLRALKVEQTTDYSDGKCF